MNGAIAIRSEPTLENLAELIKCELGSSDVKFRAGVEHAIAAGQYLLQARHIVPRGEWMRWCREEIRREPSGLYAYMRLAQNSDIVKDAGFDTIAAAIAATRGLPTRLPSTFRQIDPDHVRDLRATGLSMREVADQIGTSPAYLYNVLSPQKCRERRRRWQIQTRGRTQRERAALAREERAALVKRRGGAPAEAYSLIRRALQILDAASSEVSSAEAKRHIRTATTRLHVAEDEIAMAVKLS